MASDNSHQLAGNAQANVSSSTNSATETSQEADIVSISVAKLPEYDEDSPHVELNVRSIPQDDLNEEEITDYVFWFSFNE